MPASEDLRPGAWLWWFWLFFIHDDQTARTGKCRQIMILWSIKLDKRIQCNRLDIQVPEPVRSIPAGGGSGARHILDGATAAWYFDGKKMHDDFILEPGEMHLDPCARSLDAPGLSFGSHSARRAGDSTSTSFRQEGEEFITTIRTPQISFEFHARQSDTHPALGPTHNKTIFPAGLALVEGTRLERMDLSGFEFAGKMQEGSQGKEMAGRQEKTTGSGESGGLAKAAGRINKKKIHGTAYFQKILMAAPPPQWYWGLYHFPDGSMATYMQTYVGAATLKDNLGMAGLPLGGPALTPSRDILIYHAPSRQVFEGHELEVKIEQVKEAKEGGKPRASTPSCGAPRSSGPLYIHHLSGGGPGFRFSARARAHAHACWSFEKNIGVLPVRSAFKYNEYPAVLEKLEITPDAGPAIRLKMGWGNMENSWGFLI